MRDPRGSGMHTISTTEAAVPRAASPWGSRATGAVLCGLGMVLATLQWLAAAALGLELLALGFWCWARATPDRDEQLPRWGWLRRPAGALWLAAACEAVLGASPDASPAVRPISMVLAEPYSARSSASAPAPLPTPPVSTSANGWGPIGTAGAATRTVHRPVAGAFTSTASSTLTLS